MRKLSFIILITLTACSSNSESEPVRAIDEPYPDYYYY